MMMMKIFLKKSFNISRKKMKQRNELYKNIFQNIQDKIL